MTADKDIPDTSIRINSQDLISRAGGPSEFQDCDEHLLDLVVAMLVKLSDYGGTDSRSAAEILCNDHPGLLRAWGYEHVRRLAESVLWADIVSLSAQFTQMFAEFNRHYFSGRLPIYEVRVVFDLHSVADEPIIQGSVSRGLIRFSERCIYIRYTRDFPMTETLLHEMAHAATDGNHDEPWVDEMKRLKEAGAPIADDEFE